MKFWLQQYESNFSVQNLNTRAATLIVEFTLEKTALPKVIHLSHNHQKAKLICPNSR